MISSSPLSQRMKSPFPITLEKTGGSQCNGSAPASLVPKSSNRWNPLEIWWFWIWWDQRRILLSDFLPQVETINADHYYETLKKLSQVIQNKTKGIWTLALHMLHDKAQHKVARSTNALMNQFGWDLLSHLICGSGLATSA